MVKLATCNWEIYIIGISPSQLTFYTIIIKYMEIRKDIFWYEWLYKVSNMWRIKSTIIKKPKYNKNLYEQTMLCKNWKKKYFYTHRLVAQAFIKNLDNKIQINHKDGNRKNNKLDNLERVNCWENHKHAYKYLWRKPVKINDKLLWYWTGIKWRDHCRSKKVIQFDKYGNQIKIRDSTKDACEKLWYCRWLVSSACRWKLKSAWGFIWKYL